MPDDATPVEIDITNYAEDPEVAKRALTFLQSSLPACRSDRSAFNADCQQKYNIWDCRRDIYYYAGRAAVYIAAGHKALERAGNKQIARLFPAGDDCFDLTMLPQADDASAEITETLDAHKALMTYNLHQSIKIRQWMPSWIRQLNILGTSPLAIDYVTEEEVRGYSGAQQVRPRTSYRLARRKAPEEGNPLIAEAVPHIDEIGPTARPVDLLTWYIWPATARSVTDEGAVVFEDQLVSGATLKKWRKAGRYHFEDEALRAHAGQSPADSIWRASERLSERGVSTSDPDNNLYVLTTAYAFWSPVDAEGADPIPCQFACVNDSLVIEARQNQKWHQQPPYVVARLFDYIDEFYGRSLIHFTQTLQYLINDLTNQTLDGMSYTLNPISCIDPDFPDPDLLQYRPGAKWPIDIKKVFFLQIPDKSVQGFAAVRQLYEFSQDVAGASSGGMHLPTMGLAQGAKTATGQSLLVAMGDIDVAAMVGAIEKQAVEPMLKIVDSMEQQFLPIHGERVLRALGPTAMPLLRNGMAVRRDMMLGTRLYSWTGNAVSEQREKFQKEGPGMLKILAELKGTQDPDYTINLAPFVKDLYRSYGFPNADEIIQIHEPGEGFDPDLEHAVMAAGWPVDPRWGEPYVQHLQVHNAALPAAMAAGWGKRLRQHMFKTLALMQKAGAKSIGPPTQAAGPQGQPGLMPGAAPGAPPPQAGAGASMNPAAVIAALQARAQGGR